MIRRFVIRVEIEYVSATEAKSKELKKKFITTFFGIVRRHPTMSKKGDFRDLLVAKRANKYEKSEITQFWRSQNEAKYHLLL